MKDVFMTFDEELKILEKNLDFLEQSGNKAHIPVLNEISETLEQLAKEFDKELLRLALCKNHFFSIENYRSNEIDSDFINERIAILEHIGKFENKIYVVLDEKNLSDSNNELMVSEISKKVYPKIEYLTEKCYELQKMLKVKED